MPEVCCLGLFQKRMDVVICLMGEALLHRLNGYLFFFVGGEYPCVYLIIVFFLELDHA